MPYRPAAFAASGSDQPGVVGLVSSLRLRRSWIESGDGCFAPPVVAAMPLASEVQVQPACRVMRSEPGWYCDWCV
jgi:hypothetical protein